MGNATGDERSASRSVIVAVTAAGLALSVSLYPAPGLSPINIFAGEGSQVREALNLPSDIESMSMTFVGEARELEGMESRNIGNLLSHSPELALFAMTATLLDSYDLSDVVGGQERFVFSPSVLSSPTLVYGGGYSQGFAYTLPELLMMLNQLSQRVTAEFFAFVSGLISQLLQTQQQPASQLHRDLPPMTAVAETPSHLPAPASAPQPVVPRPAEAPGSATPTTSTSVSTASETLPPTTERNLTPVSYDPAPPIQPPTEPVPSLELEEGPQTTSEEQVDPADPDIDGQLDDAGNPGPTQGDHRVDEVSGGTQNDDSGAPAGSNPTERENDDSPSNESTAG